MCESYSLCIHDVTSAASVLSWSEHKRARPDFDHFWRISQFPEQPSETQKLLRLFGRPFSSAKILRWMVGLAAVGRKVSPGQVAGFLTAQVPACVQTIVFSIVIIIIIFIILRLLITISIHAHLILFVAMVVIILVTFVTIRFLSSLSQT